MKEISQTSKSRGFVRSWLIRLGWLMSLIALFYGISDWRGRHAWNKYRQDYEARIGSLDLQAYVPKDIADSVNFGATPFAKAWFTQRDDTNFLYYHDAWSQAAKLMPDSPQSQVGGHFNRTFEDLMAWQKVFAIVLKRGQKVRSDKLDPSSRAQAAPAVLAALKDDGDAFEEMREASTRPEARYAIAYDLNNPPAILLPHLTQIKFTCRRLELKACAELAVGQNDSALEDVKLMFYLIDTLKPEPFLISYVVRAVCVPIAVQPIWEGLAEHRWTDAQLQELQACLESNNFLADMQRPLRAERASGVLTTELLKKRGSGILLGIDSPDIGTGYRASLNLLGRIVPAGWYDQEKLHYCQGFDQLLNGVVDVASKRVFPEKLAGNRLPMPTMSGAIFGHHIIEQIMLSALDGIPAQSAAAQTATDEAATACALERYYLANSRYPEDLLALVPRFIAQLPNDVIAGQPLRYRRIDDVRFVLYSVGWNRTDDGGVSGQTMFDENGGDWVW